MSALYILPSKQGKTATQDCQIENWLSQIMSKEGDNFLWNNQKFQKFHAWNLLSWNIMCMEFSKILFYFIPWFVCMIQFTDNEWCD